MNSVSDSYLDAVRAITGNSGGSIADNQSQILGGVGSIADRLKGSDIKQQTLFDLSPFSGTPEPIPYISPWPSPFPTLTTSINFTTSVVGSAPTLPSGWVAQGTNNDFVTEEGPLVVYGDGTTEGRNVKVTAGATSYKRLVYSYTSSTAARMVGFFFKMQETPNVSLYLTRLLASNVGICDWRINTNRTVSLRDGSTVNATSVDTLAVGTVYWCEYLVSGLTQTVRFYTVDSQIALFSLTSSITSNTSDQICVGHMANFNGLTTYFDRICIGSDWIRTPSTIPALFPGHVVGKLHFGWSTSHDDASAETQLNNQTPLPVGGPASYSDLLGVRRLFSKDSFVINRVDTNNRVLWISAKPADFGVSGALSLVNQWDTIASGSRDGSIITYFSDLVSRDKLTIFTFHHEPIGDIAATADANTFCAAWRRIMQVVDTNYPGHRIIFTPIYEENRLRNLRVGQPNAVNWALWLPENLLPGKGGTRPWDFISFDIYQYGPANTSTNPQLGVQFSHRWWRIEDMFRGLFTPNGSTVMPYMDYTPGEDIVFGIGECASRPGAFYWYENGGGTSISNMTGAKYARDMLDFIFDNSSKFAFVSWFNSIGANIVYNDERLYPADIIWGGDDPNHDFTVQTGDTELTLNIYREKLALSVCNKLAASGMPVGWV